MTSHIRKILLPVAIRPAEYRDFFVARFLLGDPPGAPVYTEVHKMALKLTSAGFGWCYVIQTGPASASSLPVLIPGVPLMGASRWQQLAKGL